ncbi:MAG: hypothetical protein JWQ89_1758 [Devosia sp.]|uniref:hypothetical protein n=1 Tax=Devosia sp. TaxID=1871048 RepID=UPI00260B28BB|nr:hypothetical protein [Devosia sp.]MDB5540031.1 hypothetical protein [Devosia sp.]
MRRLQASASLGLLLGLSLTLKALGSFELTEITAPQDVSAFLHSIGFSESGPIKEPWIEARSGKCTIEVMQVSPQGWERSAVAEYAGGRKLAYFHGSERFSEHPVISATLDHYLSRLTGYLHLPFTATPVWAVIDGPQCPDQLRAAGAEEGAHP